MADNAEELLNEMITKINLITNSLDGTIAQLNKMNESIRDMREKFSEEIVSLTENIRLIVEVLKQFRIRSSKEMQELSEEFNKKIKKFYEQERIKSITQQEREAIDLIKQASRAVSNNLYYVQLLSIISTIREEVNRIMGVIK
ncbi:MAG: hypothetical protein ACTSU4_13985 [Promethearchaeota archaeon]